MGIRTTLLDAGVKVKLIEEEALRTAERAEIIALCNRAFEADLEPLFQMYAGATHIVGLLRDSIVSHAMWVTRWLQSADGPLLRTAYVEMVATEYGLRGRGYATTIMQELAKAITDYDLGALSPAEPGLYSKLGWVFWRGPLTIRCRDGLIPIPDERAMILRLPRTPALDLDAPLSAEWREGELW